MASRWYKILETAPTQPEPADPDSTKQSSACPVFRLHRPHQPSHPVHCVKWHLLDTVEETAFHARRLQQSISIARVRVLCSTPSTQSSARAWHTTNGPSGSPHFIHAEPERPSPCRFPSRHAPARCESAAQGVHLHPQPLHRGAVANHLELVRRSSSMRSSKGEGQGR